MSTKRRIVSASAATVLLLMASFLTLGIPGALLIELTAAIFAPLGAKPPTGDAGWPAAILVAFAMPFGVLALAIVPTRKNPLAGAGASIGWAALGYLAAGVLASLVVVFVLASK